MRRKNEKERGGKGRRRKEEGGRGRRKRKREEGKEYWRYGS